MVEIETTRMSSKGQVVIPVNFRSKIKEGETLLVFNSGNQIILKPASAMEKQMAEDIESARRTELAWKQIEQGKCKTYSNVDEFLKRLHGGSPKNF